MKTRLNVCEMQIITWIILTCYVIIDQHDITMENHIFLLQSKCRGCNCDIQVEQKTFAVAGCSEIILKAFEVNVLEDEDMVHPKRLCSRCRAVLYRLKASQDRKQKTSTDLTLYKFQPHSDSCELCFPVDHVDVETKKRKWKAGPGRGKTLSHIVPAPATHSPQTADLAITGESSKQPDPQILVDTFKKLNTDDRADALRNLVTHLSLDDKAMVAKFLGESEGNTLQSEAFQLRGDYKDIEKLKNFNICQFVRNTNIVTKSFLEGACNVSSETSGEYGNNTFMLACLFDMMYKLRVPSLVTPLSFMKNLTMFISQDRKWIAKLNAASSAGGSYTTISEWLKLQAHIYQPSAPEGDILNVFDNDQVVGKTHTVRPNNRVNLSIITNRAWIPIDSDGTLQQRDDLKPEKWMGDTNKEAFHQAIHVMVLGDKSHPVVKKHNEIHRSQQTLFLYRAIEEVKHEQMTVDGSVVDLIDQKVEMDKINKLYVKCTSCSELVAKRKKKCTNCGVDLTASKQTAASTSQQSQARRSVQMETMVKVGNEGGNIDKEERYPHITSNHTGKPTPVKVADPVLCNPNSYQTLIMVLRQIGKDADIHRYGGKTRHWTVVCCDGLPYHLCLKIIDTMLTCTYCNSSFFGAEILVKHHNSTHQRLSKDPSFFREFDWVVMRIGHGHYEMNMVKSFTELNWQPFLSDLSSVLSFKSLFAQQSAKRCDSHHKAWSVLISFFLGTLKELVLDYVRECLSEDTNPTPQGYMNYAKAKQHIPNFWYMHEQVMTYALSIVVLRMGIRRNNFEFVQSAKHQFKGIFFGRHHPIYAKIEVHDTLQNLIFPDPLKHQMANVASFSVSGDKSKGQDADFILEEVNKESKSWISRGVPDDAMWFTICRNLESLKEMKKKMKLMSGTDSSSDTTYRQRNLDPNVEAWRCRLRETAYLRGSSEKHTSITGESLHNDLSSFKRSAESKRSNRIANAYLDRSEQQGDNHPVFVTAEEDAQYNSVEKKTIPEIKTMIDNAIRFLIESEDDQDYLLSKYSKTKRKAEFVSLYHEIQLIHTNQTSSQTNDEVEDEVD